MTIVEFRSEPCAVHCAWSFPALSNIPIIAALSFAVASSGSNIARILILLSPVFRDEKATARSGKSAKAFGLLIMSLGVTPTSAFLAAARARPSEFLGRLHHNVATRDREVHPAVLAPRDWDRRTR